MIRPAVSADLEAIAAIYEEILTLEDARPRSYTNWQRGKYPTIDTARSALESGWLWVAEENGEIYASFLLNDEQLPEYDHIPWHFSAARDEVAVVHTLVVSPRWAGQGRARAIIAFCEEESRRRGKRVLRLDTAATNDPANVMYPRLGFRFAGSGEFFFQCYTHEVLNCYEKQL